MDRVRGRDAGWYVSQCNHSVWLGHDSIRLYARRTYLAKFCGKTKKWVFPRRFDLRVAKR